MSSDHRDGSTRRFFFHLNKQTSVHSSSDEKWGECTRFYWDKLSHFNSQVFTLDLICDYCRLLGAERFLRNPRQIKWVTNETRYHLSIAELLKRNLRSHVVELFQRPRTMLKILYFSWDHQFFKKSLWIKFPYWLG